MPVRVGVATPQWRERALHLRAFTKLHKLLAQPFFWLKLFGEQLLQLVRRFSVRAVIIKSTMSFCFGSPECLIAVVLSSVSASVSCGVAKKKLPRERT